MRLAGAALLLALAGCGDDAAKNEATPLDGASVVLQSEDAVAGRRPELTLICGARGHSFSLALVRPAEANPGNATGLIKIDDAAPVRIGLVWLGADRWAPALEAEAETALVRAMLAGDRLYFTGPEGTTDRAYRWELARLGAGLADMRARCR